MRNGIILFFVLILSGCQSQFQKVVLHEPDRKDGDYQIIKVYPPHYADHLRKARIQGWVVVKFSVNEKGKVDQAEVVDETPKGLFSEEALQSVIKTIYKPAFQNGVPVRTNDILTKVSFKLAKEVAPKNIRCSNSTSEYGNESCTEVN